MAWQGRHGRGQKETRNKERERKQTKRKPLGASWEASWKSLEASWTPLGPCCKRVGPQFTGPHSHRGHSALVESSKSSALLLPLLLDFVLLPWAFPAKGLVFLVRRLVFPAWRFVFVAWGFVFTAWGFVPNTPAPRAQLRTHDTDTKLETRFPGWGDPHTGSTPQTSNPKDNTTHSTARRNATQHTTQTRNERQRNTIGTP